jgi:hypothetical protein
MTGELIGKSRYDGSELALYEVEELTIKESDIAGRMDLMHAEKMEAIPPLRDKRRAASTASAMVVSAGT